jgi:hypothetical protein
MERPKHDSESLALEEQFDIPSISLDFPGEGRVVIPVDGRKASRELRECDAKLSAIVARNRARDEAAAKVMKISSAFAASMERIHRDAGATPAQIQALAAAIHLRNK